MTTFQVHPGPDDFTDDVLEITTIFRSDGTAEKLTIKVSLNSKYQGFILKSFVKTQAAFHEYDGPNETGGELRIFLSASISCR